VKRLFDNCDLEKECQSFWGYSLYIEEYNLLFDTGSNGRVLLKNMQKQGVDIKDIKHLFISHSHWDHIGGIDSIIELNSNLTLYVPSSLSKHLIKDLKTQVKELVICTKKPKMILDGLYTTGLLGDDTPEQSLIIDADETKLITGCGHYGVQNIVKVAKDVIKKDIKYVYGGFHLLHSDDEKIKQTILMLKDLGVSKAEATHCSGDRAIDMFREAFR